VQLERKAEGGAGEKSVTVHRPIVADRRPAPESHVEITDSANHRLPVDRRDDESVGKVGAIFDAAI
jgi:hypothetical protein